MTFTRHQLHKLRDAIPAGDLSGMYIHRDGVEHFITFEELQTICQAIMHPINESVVEQQFGKMHYSKDPTYNMGRKK